MYHIQVIINPASGKDIPILKTLNRVFRKYDVQWGVDITRNPGDGTRRAKEAVANGADIVASYGGDGTIMEIVNGLIGTEVPLAILPGGTGNALAKELNIPLDLAKAAELICESPKTERIDLGRLSDKYFLLHVYTGMESSQRATREMKDRFGILAYVFSALQVISTPGLKRYRLTVDGQEFEREGVLLFLMNTFALGIDPPVVEQISPHDGLLNLFMVKTDVFSAVKEAAEIQSLDNLIESWRGRKIEIHAEPEEEVWMDGEPAGKTPCTIEVVPAALPVISG